MNNPVSSQQTATYIHILTMYMMGVTCALFIVADVSLLNCWKHLHSWDRAVEAYSAHQNYCNSRANSVMFAVH